MLFGNEFISGYPILIILSIGQFFSVWAGPVGTFLLMSGNQNFNRNISVITTILFLVSCPILTKFFGIMGASISISFIYIARNFIYVFYIYKKYNITFLYVPFFTKNNK
jgi:O-antigen/teichoic acid export membrane protein